jgi:hypothetical protein
MTVASDLIIFGELTGSGTQDEVYTATTTCYVIVTIFNRSASTRTLQVWLNAVADANKVADGDELLTKETLVYETKMGSGDKFIVEASGVDVNATVEVDTLT